MNLSSSGDSYSGTELQIVVQKVTLIKSEDLRVAGEHEMGLVHNLVSVDHLSITVLD